jgi:ABC-type polysaccharide transport system permease subunit
MTSCNSTKRYEVAVFAALAVLVVMAVGALLNAGFNAHYIL